MRNFVRTAFLLVAFVMLGASSSHAQISLGIRIGPPPAPREIRVLPPSPGPGFLWVGGYWYPDGGHYHWHDGYWTRPPYAGAHWVEPHHDGRQFFNGYWDGDHGRVEHDHRWDNDRDRDKDRYQDHGRDSHDHDDHH